MISTIFSFLPFIFIIYFFIVVSRSKSISYYLKSGKRCFSCKEELETDFAKALHIILTNESNYQICKSCEREQKLDSVFSINKIHKSNKLKLYLIDSKFDKTFRYLLFSIIFLLIIDIVLKLVFDIKWFTYFYNTYLIFYWLLTIYRHRLTSIKKPSH